MFQTFKQRFNSMRPSDAYMRQRIDPHWFRQWLVAWTTPSHYVNQCWNIVNWTFRNKLQWNFHRNSYIFIQESALENVVCETAPILSRPQCINDYAVFSLFVIALTSTDWGSISCRERRCPAGGSAHSCDVIVGIDDVTNITLCLTLVHVVTFHTDEAPIHRWRCMSTQENCTRIWYIYNTNIYIYNISCFTVQYRILDEEKLYWTRHKPSPI